MSLPKNTKKNLDKLTLKEVERVVKTLEHYGEDDPIEIGKKRKKVYKEFVKYYNERKLKEENEIRNL